MITVYVRICRRFLVNALPRRQKLVSPRKTKHCQTHGFQQTTPRDIWISCKLPPQEEKRTTNSTRFMHSRPTSNAQRGSSKSRRRAYNRTPPEQTDSSPVQKNDDVGTSGLQRTFDRPFVLVLLHMRRRRQRNFMQHM